MKKVLLGIVMAAVLGTMAMGGPLIGLDLVPSGGVWVPYLEAGYDTGWSLVTVGTNMPYALILNGWYNIQVSRLFSITETGNTRWGGILGVWVNLCNGSFTGTSIGIGPMVTAQMQGMNVALKLFLFNNVSGSSHVFGLQPTLSFWFDFIPNCGTTEPGCEADW